MLRYLIIGPGPCIFEIIEYSLFLESVCVGKQELGLVSDPSITPTMWLYLPCAGAPLRGITTFRFCARRVIFTQSHVMNKEGTNSWLTIATSHNDHKIKHTSFRVHTYSPTTDEAKRKEDNPTARSPIVPTGLHY